MVHNSHVPCQLQDSATRRQYVVTARDFPGEHMLSKCFKSESIQGKGVLPLYVCMCALAGEGREGLIVAFGSGFHMQSEGIFVTLVCSN